jgi:hypothetical protein
MPETRYRGRRAHQIENNLLRVTVLVEGGHIAEVLHKPTGINPFWTPPWPTMEPSGYTLAAHPEYGADAESKLLAGVMGHILCLDVFGPPSPDEAAAGITFHGEAAVNAYHIEANGEELRQRTMCAHAGLEVTRRLRLDGSTVHVVESIRNVTSLDRPIAWTQHATLGPPFLENGATQFRAPVTRSRTADEKDFDWPFLPRPDGLRQDLRLFSDQRSSESFSAHLIDPEMEDAWFLAWSPRVRLLLGYRWRRKDFPWLAVWEENCATVNPPWNGKTRARGMEFGVSPMSETRRQMIDRNTLFQVPVYRWIPAGATLTVEYLAYLVQAERMPEEPPKP